MHSGFLSTVACPSIRAVLLACLSSDALVSCVALHLPCFLFAVVHSDLMFPVVCLLFGNLLLSSRCSDALSYLRFLVAF